MNIKNIWKKAPINTKFYHLQVKPTFSAQEMNRRLDMVRSHMESNDLGACVFTSYHNIHYFSDFLFCCFGRPYAFIVTPTKTISVSAGKAISSFFQVSLWQFENMVFLDLTSPTSQQRGRVEPWRQQRVVSLTRNFSLSCHSSPVGANLKQL